VIPELRSRFNQAWTPALYSDFLQRLDQAARAHVGFRCSETPVFLPPALLDRMVRYGRELYEQLDSKPEYRKASHSAIPERFRVPNEPEHALFIQADFGLVRESDGNLEPKLVEIQGFPSLYGLQPAMADVYSEAFDLERTVGVKLAHLLGGYDRRSYTELLGRVILSGHAPEEVVLLEIDPYEQKTLADFLVTEKMLGIRIASLAEVEKRGRKLFLHGIPIRRIYNRVIVDELMRKDIETAFQFTDDLDVEWAGHPNWFFRLSKFSLPFFDHICVPKTWFLSNKQAPDNLSHLVLKPLYSFAGQGVVIGPTRDEINSIPESERGNYILQEKMDFVPTLETPDGMTKTEIRIMYVRDQDQLKPVTTIIRTGRGKMMGVDFNKNLDWVGASAGFYPTA